MKDKLRKLAEDYTVSTEAGQALYNELCVLFNVVGQSEQLSLCQCDKPSPDIMYGKTCAECCLDINPKA